MTFNLKAPLALAALVLGAAACASSTGTAGSHPATPAAAHSASTPVPASFGTAEHVPDGQGGTLIITPVDAWWLSGKIQSRYDSQAASEGLSPAENGAFLVIEMRVQAASPSAAFPAPISGAGPAIVSNHQAVIPENTSAASNVVWNTCLPSVDSNVTLHPGSYLLDGETFDIPRGPALLEWTGGAPGTLTVEWGVPACDTGKLPANVLAAIKTGSGC